MKKGDIGDISIMNVNEAWRILLSFSPSSHSIEYFVASLNEQINEGFQTRCCWEFYDNFGGVIVEFFKRNLLHIDSLIVSFRVTFGTYIMFAREHYDKKNWASLRDDFKAPLKVLCHQGVFNHIPTSNHEIVRAFMIYLRKQ